MLQEGLAALGADAFDLIEAGADGLVIPSNQSSAAEIAAFSQEFQKFESRVPLVAVPTTYDSVHDDGLAELGFSLVVYANHLLRSAYPAMVCTAEAILRNGRALEERERVMPAGDLISLLSTGT